MFEVLNVPRLLGVPKIKARLHLWFCVYICLCYLAAANGKSKTLFMCVPMLRKLLQRKKKKKSSHSTTSSGSTKHSGQRSVVTHTKTYTNVQGSANNTNARQSNTGHLKVNSRKTLTRKTAVLSAFSRNYNMAMGFYFFG